MGWGCLGGRDTGGVVMIWGCLDVIGVYGLPVRNSVLGFDTFLAGVILSMLLLRASVTPPRGVARLCG